MKKDYVTYEQFGAKGDGVTDDMPAIVACHAYANEKGLDVAGMDGANYYIGGKNLTAVIKTNVNWGKARFTIDDRNLENIKQVCFLIAPDHERFTPAITSLCAGQKTVDFPHEGKVYVQVFNREKMVYIRKGLNQSNGHVLTDCFVVDEKGNVSGEINWDFDKITDLWAVPEDRPITVTGGIFTTIANREPSFYNYHCRNIKISRSHVTVSGLTHYVTGEEDTGAPYTGFLWVADTFDVTIENCLMTPHKTYRTASKIPGEDVSMGSYDLSFSSSVGMKIRGVDQTIDITDSRYWGLFTSNFCKDFELEECTMSRFDAHMGVTNCFIKNCALGYMGAQVIGFGKFEMENCRISSDRVINLRSDYGSTFRGEMVIKNCTWVPKAARRNRALAFIANNTGDHDFGYQCYMPQKIVIDGLRIEDEHLAGQEFTYAIFPDYDDTYATGKPYPYETPKNVVLQGIFSTTGREVDVFETAKLYPHIQGLTIEN